MIVDDLLSMRDNEYRDFHARLMPNIDYELIIGIRTPILRKYAKKIKNDDEVGAFLKKLPHHYYEENNLHGMLLALRYPILEDYLQAVEKFLPYVDNWATCDMLDRKIMRKDLELSLIKIKEWINSDYEYMIRYGILALLSNYLDEAFKKAYLDLVINIEYDSYYVRMAKAWFMAEALVKQYDTTINCFMNPCMDKWIHNKALQKARESYRISDAQKTFLKELKIK